MIQLNLLPDVKLDYIKAQRLRRIVMAVSIAVSGLAILVLIVLIGLGIAQKKQISNLDNEITSESTRLKTKPNINEILTVQNQLKSLNQLHADEPEASLLFNKYLSAVTPASAYVSQIAVDFNADTIALTGTADSLATVNEFVDCLKYTTYSITSSQSSSNSTNAFSGVVLTSFGYDPKTNDPGQAASYTINFSFDPTIFDVTQNIALYVPTFTVTRADVPQPGALFKVPPSSTASPSSSGGQ